MNHNVKIYKRDFLIVTFCCLLLVLLNVIVGAAFIPSVLLSFILFFSGMTVLVLGKGSALGIVYALFAIKSFWLAAFIKPLFLESFDEGLYTPITTLIVYSLGILGMFFSSILISFYRPRKGLLPIDDMSTGFIRIFSISLCSIGFLCWLILRVAGKQDDVLVGGVWGLIKTFSPLGIVGLALFAYVLDKNKYNNRKDNSFYFFLIIMYFLIGLVEAGKQQMMMPIVIGFFSAVRVYGIRSPRIWFSTFFGLSIFIFIIYPYAQYTRTLGIRDVNLLEATEMAIELSIKAISDRSSISNDIGDKSFVFVDYAPQGFESIGRLMFIGEADYLISQTYFRQDFTGFETITHGFKMVLPQFLYPDKPQHSTGSFLGYYAGQLGEDDYTTQVSYGFIANLYNAFGTFWVLPATFILTLFIFSCIVFYWGRPGCISPSVIIIVMTMQHSFVEGTVSSQMQVIRQPINYAILFFGLWLWFAIKSGRLKFR